jgi:lipid-A-disaccharide synthase-like uncharacterized protein
LPLAGYAQTHAFPHWETVMICIGGGVVATLIMNVAGTLLSIRYFIKMKGSQSLGKVALPFMFNVLQVLGIGTLIIIGFSIL